jgi:ADP-ribose pyrophosphatase YjhB (NUDIX family)
VIIHSKLTHLGKVYKLKYQDLDSFDNLPRKKCAQCYGVCFYKDKIVIGGNSKNNTWGLIGGSIESGETFEEALAREIREESNMKVLKSAPIGFQEVFLPQGGSIYQLRYVCLVEPLGKFIKDPAGIIKKIKLIDPEDYRKYFDWGKVGERIIQRASELKNTL